MSAIAKGLSKTKFGQKLVARFAPKGSTSPTGATTTSPSGEGAKRGLLSKLYNGSTNSGRQGSTSSQQGVGDGGPSAMEDVTNPVSILDRLCKNIIQSAKSIVDSVPSVSIFFMCIIILLAILVIILLILVLIFYARPVIPTPCHSMDYSTYMTDEYIPDFIAALKTFGSNARYYADRVLHGDAKRIIPAIIPAAKANRFGMELRNFMNVSIDVAANARQLLSQSDLTLSKNLLLYFDHYRCFTSRKGIPYSWFCGAALSHNEEWVDTSKGGRILDEARITQFENDFVKPIEILRQGVKAISDAIDGDLDNIVTADWYRANPREAFQWVLSAHKLRMFLNEYHGALSDAGMSRIPDKFAINTWILYYIPFVVDIFKYRIPQIWASLPQKYTMLHGMYVRGWAALGDVIVNLPCYLAHPNAQERQKYCTARPMTEALEAEEEEQKTKKCT